MFKKGVDNLFTILEIQTKKHPFLGVLGVLYGMDCGVLA